MDTIVGRHIRPARSRTGGRRRGLRTMSVVALLTGGLYPLIVSLDIGWASGEHAHFVAALVVIAVLLQGVTLILRGRHTAGGHLLAALAGSTAIVAAVVGNPDNHGGQAGWIDPVLAVLVLPLLAVAVIALRSPQRTPAHSVGRPPLVVYLLSAVAIVAGPAVGVQQALVQRNSWPPVSDPHHNGHWYIAATLAVLIGLLAVATIISRTNWHVPALTVAAGTGVFGLTSIIWAGEASSAGRGAGGLIVLLSMVTAVAVARAHRRATPRDRRGLLA